MYLKSAVYRVYAVLPYWFCLCPTRRIRCLAEALSLLYIPAAIPAGSLHKDNHQTIHWCTELRSGSAAPHGTGIRPGHWPCTRTWCHNAHMECIHVWSCCKDTANQNFEPQKREQFLLLPVIFYALTADVCRLSFKPIDLRLTIITNLQRLICLTKLAI